MMEAISPALAQYGVLGLWTVSLLGERYIFQSKLTQSINDLTIAIERRFK